VTILVTGAGLLGRLAARRLNQLRRPVLLADIRPPAGLNGLPSVQLDVADWSQLDHVVRTHEVGAIVHTAAMLTPGMQRDPLAGIRTNVMGTANVLEAARRHALRRVVVISSTTVAYGAFGELPLEPIPEDFAMHAVSTCPASLYSCTKLAGEHLALVYARKHGVDAVVLRVAAVLGWDGEAATSVPGQMMETLVSAGLSGQPADFEGTALLWGGVEEFVDARDCADAIVASLDAPSPRQRVYHVATGVAHTFDQVVEAVRRELPRLRIGRAPPLPRGGISGFPFQRPAPSDIKATERELGFRASRDLADTVRHLAGRGTSPNS
jgi:UDP-glucose 4-epimerase